MKNWIAIACLGACAIARGDTFVRGPQPFPVGPNPCTIVAADLTDDGWPEIVTGDRGPLTDPREERPANDELSLLIAQGDGKYLKHHPSLKTGFGPYALAIANIDALKWPDILAVSFHAVRERNLCLYLNLRQENVFKPLMFNATADTIAYHRQRDGDGAPLFTTPGLTALDVADIDGDGLRDVIAAGWAGDTLVLFPGAAETYFEKPRYIDAEGGPRDVRFADLNGDGALDIVSVLNTAGEIGIWEGDGEGGFNLHDRFPSRGLLPNGVRVADVDADGNLDLVVSHRHACDSIVVFFGDGAYGFGRSLEILLDEDRTVLEHEIRDIVVAPLNDDPFPDIAAACYKSGELIVLINEEESGGAAFRGDRYTFGDGRPRAVCTGDFNRDEKTDLAVALWGSNSVQLMLNRE